MAPWPDADAALLLHQVLSHAAAAADVDTD